MSGSELEAFKREIDLRAYAASQGYELDRKESWKGSAVMRHGNGDKIIIKRDIDGHYVYFSVRDEADNGSIIDFVARRNGLNLSNARADWAKLGKELRPWIGMPASRMPSFDPLPRTARDRMRVERAFRYTKVATHHPYLENERRIPSELLVSPRFESRVHIDSRGNAVFPHEDKDGLSGFELKNKGFTGFAAGGSKGLWMSNRLPDDNRLVLCEASIDALSYAVLFPDRHARYGSIGGKPNPIQPELIRAEAAVMPAGSAVVAAMDADEDGRKLAASVERAVQLTGRSDLRFEMHEPRGFKDWNDQLRGERHNRAVSLPPKPSVA